MDINLADVTLHVDEELKDEARAKLEEAFRSREGVISVHNAEGKPHLWVLEFNPEIIHARDLLSIVNYQGLHGELVGL